MKKSAIFKFAMLAMIAVGFIGLSGCNTMQGLGKDVSKLGDKIENKAEEKKSY
ncbi:MAG TPA: entericidin A/B family lipoprotein [Methylophilaceae bacterium]|nr:entericidin A/B family lipoprotein [Methylophilaceae bacterium]